MSTPPPLPAAAPNAAAEYVFYDGGCGVCHASVKFLALRDRDGSRFRFAPLFGEAFEAHVPAEASARLPDSLVIRRADGTLLLRSDGMLHALRRLGGAWAVLARLASWVPRPLRDWAYDRFASVRTRLVRPPEGTCPMVPPAWRGRFEA